MPKANAPARIVITQTARTKRAAIAAQNLQGFLENEFANRDPEPEEPMPRSIRVLVRKPASRAEIETARARYAAKSNDHIEVDDNADSCLAGEGGAWVAAWVFVPPNK